ncbi:hypothetical protein BBP40_001573 [Aspergillus hancockii]|nr:hypothetical protein BBP40_001573 [Aspergillus hancockii]
MKILSTTTLALALLAPAISADPAGGKAVDTVTVQLANDQSGANAGRTIPADGVKHSIVDLYGKTSVGDNGVVRATSAQLVKFQENTVCKISQKQPAVDVTLNSRQTWKSLQGGATVKLQDATLECRKT